ncbi:bacterial proteasome activator family protein [Promicromonospora sp. NPDC019610]|uniref:bacterial proteasome activator family protein n=1 Tax=Promicromonospora sp. NPDC019610 TaxID=3364405 RepID=UPI003792E424
MNDERATPQSAERPDDRRDQTHVAHPQVVTPDGAAVPPEREPESAGDEREAGEAEAVVGQVEEPAKVMRIGGMIKRLLDEVRDAPLDEAARTRLAEIHERSIHELEDGLSPDLVDELHRITLPFSDDSAPSDAELRVAQAQLVGWLEGLFHGIQTALVAQQMAAQAQLSQMRRALPPGTGAFGPGGPTLPGAPDDESGERRTPGQYL